MFQHGQSGGNRLVRYGFLLGEIAIEYISDENKALVFALAKSMALELECRKQIRICPQLAQFDDTRRTADAQRSRYFRNHRSTKLGGPSK